MHTDLVMPNAERIIFCVCEILGHGGRERERERGYVKRDFSALTDNETENFYSRFHELRVLKLF